MAESLTTKTIEGASGVTFALPFHDDASDRFYPLVQLVPAELGGLSVYSVISAASTNAAAIKTSAGQMYGFDVYNIDETPIYVKFYDLAVAPTVGTSTVKMRYGVASSASGTGADGQSWGRFWSMGIPFSTGIAVAMVVGITDADASALSASEVLLNVYYK